MTNTAPSGIHAILSERGTRYGSFYNHAMLSQSFKSVLYSSSTWWRMSVDQREALEMVVHKIARICNGDPTYRDSWVDIIGYVQLVIDELDRRAK